MNDMKGACRAIRLMEQFRKFKSDGVPGSYSVIPSDPAFFASARKIIQTARREVVISSMKKRANIFWLASASKPLPELCRLTR